MIEAGKPPTIEYACDLWGYNICSEERPWTSDKEGHWRHPSAISAGHDVDYGRGVICARYKCPVCGKSFEVELAQ